MSLEKWSNGSNWIAFARCGTCIAKVFIKYKGGKDYKVSLGSANKSVKTIIDSWKNR